MLKKEEVLHYWRYFCSLCSQLEKTTEYVSHDTIDRNPTSPLANGDTHSNEFSKLLLLAATEFETVAKLICKEFGPCFQNKKENIVSLSEQILQKFPNIGQTLVPSNYQILYPLSDWRIELNDDGQKCLCGLAWWHSYTNIKHRRYECFSDATLKNCINALASLYVLELYLGMQCLGSVSDLSVFGCRYFNLIYGHVNFMAKSSYSLPDFLEKAP